MHAKWSDIQFETRTSSFYKSKTEEAIRGGESAIWPTLICQLSIIVVSTPPSSVFIVLGKYNFGLDMGSGFHCSIIRQMWMMPSRHSIGARLLLL